MTGIPVMIDDRRRADSADVADHVRERRLLRAEKQQREKYGENGAQARHGTDKVSGNLDQQALQVLALGKGQRDGMIRRALQALDDARTHVGH